MAYTPLRNIQHQVLTKQDFTGNSVFGKWVHDHVYAVYSYAMPIYAYAAGTWFENTDARGFSRTTSRHLSAARPSAHDQTRKLSNEDMRALLDPFTEIGCTIKMLAEAGQP